MIEYLFSINGLRNIDIFHTLQIRTKFYGTWDETNTETIFILIYNVLFKVLFQSRPKFHKTWF